MKYLEDEQLASLNSILSEVEVGERALYGKLEAYTRKRAGSEKKYSHTLAERYVQVYEEQHEPPRKKRSRSVGVFEETKPVPRRNRSSSFDVSRGSTLGDLAEQGTRKLLMDLILTLNASFPDYDFGDISPDDFSKQVTSDVVRRVNESLTEVSLPQAFLSELWKAMDQVVGMEEQYCEVYSYHDEEGFLRSSMVPEQETSVLWSFNYLFVNRQRKRIVLFTCLETMRIRSDVEATEYVVQDSGTAADVDFDLDPEAGAAGGIPVSPI